MHIKLIDCDMRWNLQVLSNLKTMYCSYYTLFKTESCLQGNIRLVGPSSTAVMECGELLGAQGLIQEMVKWCVDNLDNSTLVR